MRSKWVWAVGGVVLLVGLYALLGFKLAPRLVRSQAIEYVRETYGRELAIGEVRIHPFKLQAEVRDLSLPDRDGKPMLGFQRLFVDFQVSSIWERAFVFREVAVDVPYVRTVIHADGSVNLADLAPPEDAEEEEGPLPAVWIQHFALSDGIVQLLNNLRRHPVERHFEPVTFTLQDFRTTPEGGGFGLTARSRQEETFEWRGRFALEPEIASEGEFHVADLLVPGVAEFLGETLPFQLPRGHIDLDGTYAIKLGETFTLDVTLPQIKVTDTALRARGVEEDWIEVPSLVVSDTRLAMPANTVNVGALTFDSLKARLWLAADGQLNTDRLFASSGNDAAAPGPASATPTAAPPTSDAAPPATAATPESTGTGPDWTLAIATVTVKSGALDFQDRTVRPTARFALTPLDVTLRGMSLDLTRPLPIEVATTINGGAKFAGSGELVPDTGALQLDVDVVGFKVKDLQPYVNGTTDLTIRAGTLAAKGRFAMGPAGTGEPELSFTGDGSLAGFRSIDNALEQDFLNFERVEVRKLSYAMAPDALSIDRVRVVKPFARVIVSSDGILNASAVFDPAGTAAAAAEAKAAAAAKTAEAARKKTRAEVRAEKKAADAAAKARAKAAAAPAPALKETGMPIRIREVTVTGGTMDFADYSVQPNFAAAIQSLGGRVSGLSSDPNSRATVDLDGNVGEFSPVNINGTVQPFAYDRYTDIGLKFQNISLPVFNPYSGKFAGYNIAKGKLTTDLHYTIEARRLNAQHRVRIDQLEWGEATAAKGEATLPVKFATSLLKDSDGVIDLDIPVSGTLDDPSFRIGPIVWQVIKNLMTKVVTAPFKALGALFKGAEEAQFIDFAPGQATVEATTAEGLAQLGRSLAPKPDLRLEVPIGVDAERDGQALAQARYEQERARAMTTVLGGGKKRAADAPPLPDFDTLEPERRLEVLTALYRQLAGTAPQIPEPPAPAEDLPRKERKAQALQASLDWLEAEARKRATPLPGELERLGQARGEAIQKALLTNTGLAPERVFLARDGKVGAEGDRVRFELEIK
ncbi:MAG TPA: DUF748 domain-containing protein [Steroidobacteraceae bacterium]|nr:DUF748 domain-containing protein [Steroidobacteraceae bacterium]